MAERPSGKKLTANELVLQKLKETFERNENINVNSNGTNLASLMQKCRFAKGSLMSILE